jgi:hypothetical protein
LASVRLAAGLDWTGLESYEFIDAESVATGLSDPFEYAIAGGDCGTESYEEAGC